MLPRIERLTEDVSAHPSKKVMDQLTHALDTNSLEGGKPIATAEGSHVQPGAGVSRSGPVVVEKEEESVMKDEESVFEEKWAPTPEWISSWKNKMPLQTIMRMLQVCVLHLCLLKL